MSTITTIQSSDLITNSRTVINTNFSNLNTDKFETSNVDIDTTLAANSDSKVASQKAVKAYIDSGGSSSFINSLIPTGIVLPYTGSAAPTNWFLCDGSAKSRTTYATLFSVISTSYGVGDGSTTFNIPDMRGRIPVGAGTGTKVATFVSRASNVITISGLTNISANEFQTGQAVLYSAPVTPMTGLTDNTTYYVIRVTNSTFSLASSLANAQNGTAIALSSDGSGTQTFTKTFTARTVGDTGGEEEHAMSSTELLAHTHTFQGSPRATGGSLSGPAGSSSVYTTFSIDNTGGNAAMNAMQPFVSTNYIIKYS